MVTTKPQRNESLPRRLLNGVRPIPKKLWLHKVISAIRITVGAITFATMVFAAYYGKTAWMHQQQVVADANLRRVEADVRHYNDPSKRWTESKVADVSQLPIVEFGYPRKEVTVQLTVDGTKHEFASLEGVIGREPELRDASLTWGRPLGREPKPEVILSRRFYERLGGHVGVSGPESEHVSVIVTRVVNGIAETQRIEMQIAGLLRRETEKIYAPLDLAINLDRWQTHKSDSPLGESAQTLESLVSYDHVDAYVPARLTEKVAEEEAAFGVQAQRVGEIEIVQASGDIWAQIISQNDRQSIDAAACRNALKSVQHELWPVWLVQEVEDEESQLLLGLRDDDPRWQSAPTPTAPPVGEFVVSDDRSELLKTRSSDIVVRRADRRLRGVPAADAICTFQSLQWLRFDEEQLADVAHQTRIDINNIETAIGVDDRYPGAIRSPQPFAWAMYEVSFADAIGPHPDSMAHSGVGPNPSRGSNQSVPYGEKVSPEFRYWHPVGSLNIASDVFQFGPTLLSTKQPRLADLGELVDWLRKHVPDYQFAMISRGVARFDKQLAGDRSPVRALTRIRFVPTSLFSRIAGQPVLRLSNDPSLPCMFVGPREDMEGLRSLRIAGRAPRPLRELSCSQTEIWVPMSFSDLIPADTAAVGFLAVGKWQHVNTLKAAVDNLPQNVAIRKLLTETPQSFALHSDVTIDQTLHLLVRQGFEIANMSSSRSLSLPLNVRQSGRTVADHVTTNPDLTHDDRSDGDVWISSVVDSGATGTITIGDRKFDNLSLRQDSRSRSGDAQVSPRLFRRLAFEHARLRNDLPEPQGSALTVRLADTQAFRQAESKLHEIGCQLKPLVELKRTQFAKYAVHTLGQDGKSAPVSSAKAGQLIMARPTFHAVTPRISIEARVADINTHVTSTMGTNDLLWFDTKLVAGRPEADSDETFGICLSKDIAERAFPGIAFDDVIGQMVRFRLDRGDGGRSPDISLLLKVTAITDATACAASLKNVSAWRLWQDGKLVYDNATHQFRTPSDVYDRRGFISAVFYAASDNAVRPLVEYLRSAGCDVKHQLDDQDRLMQLAIAVTTLVLLFVSGSILNACANSGAVAWMDLATKQREIGVKMAYGVTRADIEFVYLCEGFLVGTAACVCGTALVIGTDPMLRDLILQTIGLEPDFFIVPIYSSEMRWLYAAATAVVVGFNMLGTFVPTWLSLRKSPIELMKA